MLILIYEEIQNDNKQKQKNLNTPLSLSLFLDKDFLWDPIPENATHSPIYQLSLTMVLFYKECIIE